MKKTIRLCSCLIALLMALSLIGCNADSVNSSPQSKSTSAVTEEAPEASGTYMNGAMFQFGLAPADDGNGNAGYVNMKGQWVIQPQFTSAHSFSPNGYAFVRVLEGVEALFRCIDLKGEFVSDLRFAEDSPRGFSECGIALVTLKDENGNKQKAFFYEGENGFELRYLNSFGEGIATYGFSDDGYATMILPDGGSGMIDSNFEWVIQPSPTLELNRYGIVNGMCAASDSASQTSGFMDASGNWVYTLDQYHLSFWQDAVYADNGLACVRNEVRDRSGNVVFSLRDMEGELLYDFTTCDCLCFREPSSQGGDTYDRFVYYDVNGNKFAYNVKHRNLNWLGYVPKLFADRIMVVMPLKRDADGKAMDVDWEATDHPQAAIISSSREFIFALDDVSAGAMSSYYTDGYAWIDQPGDDGYCAIIDTNGNIVCQFDSATGVRNILSDYKSL